MIGKIAAALAAGLVSGAALAQVTVSDAWIRATVPAQTSTGAFMRVQSASDARLVGVRTPVAARAELHRMEMQGQTMRMQAVEAIDLPAGKPVELASGGYHIMLFGLKQQMKDGETVPLTLVVEERGRKRAELNLAVPVRPLSYRPGR